MQATAKFLCCAILALGGVATSASDAAAPFAYIVVERGHGTPPKTSTIVDLDVRNDLPNGDPMSLGPIEETATGYVAISPAGRFVYVGLIGSSIVTGGAPNTGRIAVVDTQKRKVVKYLLAQSSPVGAIAITPDGGTLYAFQADPALPKQGIVVLSLPSGETRGLIPLEAAASVIAVSPNGNTVVTQAKGGLAFIDRETNTVSSTLAIPGSIYAVAFSPDSATMYVTTDDQIVRIDVPNRVVRDSMPVGTYARALDISVDGRRLYITNGTAPGRVTVVNADLWQITTTISVGDYPMAISATPEGDKVYVASPTGVSVLSTQSNTVIATIQSLGNVANRVTSFVGASRAAIPESVEYFHQGFDHYFTTNIGIEIDKLDAGDFTGWVRTGGLFNVFLAPTVLTVSVCRFFGNSFGGKSSHFFAPRGLGCEDAFGNPDWQYEGNVYNVRLPDQVGACPASTEPVYRLYNNGQGGAPNHRLTMSLSERQAMLARGWIAEGAGVGVGMCTPRP